MSNRHQAKHNTTKSGSTKHTHQTAGGVNQTKVADQSTGENNPHHQMSTNKSVNTDYLHPQLDEGWGKELDHSHWKGAPDLGGAFG